MRCMCGETISIAAYFESERFGQMVTRRKCSECLAITLEMQIKDSDDSASEKDAKEVFKYDDN